MHSAFYKLNLIILKLGKPYFRFQARFILNYKIKEIKFREKKTYINRSACIKSSE